MAGARANAPDLRAVVAKESVPASAAARMRLSSSPYLQIEYSAPRLTDLSQNNFSALVHKMFAHQTHHAYGLATTKANARDRARETTDATRI